MTMSSGAGDLQATEPRVAVPETAGQSFDLKHARVVARGQQSGSAVQRGRAHGWMRRCRLRNRRSALHSYTAASVGSVGDHDAVVVGAGPNGLVAAVTLARAGWRVVVLEAAATPGGGTRTAELTKPGFLHDVCSAIHPLAVGSPALAGLPLTEHGVKWIHPAAPLAHVLDDGRAAFLERSIEDTARH